MDKRDTMIMAAKMYYLDGLSQEEIAKQIHLSRPSVSRLLQACVREGVVQIRIDDVSSYGGELGRRIVDTYGIRAAIVVPQGHSEEADKEKVGQAAAAYIESLLSPGMQIGIAWGTTIHSIVQHIKASNTLKADVIQLLGGMGNKTNDTDAGMMALTLAKALGGDGYILQAPFMVQSKILRDLLMEEPHVKSHFQKIKTADIAIIGLGSTKPELSAQFRSGHITLEDSGRLINEGAVGDICGSYIDINGLRCHSSLCDRMIAVSLDDLKRIPTVIGAAAGDKKADIIVGALRGRYIDVLITDEKAAAGVLNYQ
jgi:DNA-binding transcriptional regulator LsrR (DeoR family)